ncbi:expressed unknown protein [Seminavis robusta]|uniref:Uncharacterized protein n=1 Tax=Seminavis robusta TaxID=568900 RepID=A0A9N8DUN3_9STRA|nr:expressed unknown protein [Seminavis robusta]|eukprot:Sro294_g110150.1 n/a (230) ;mRNA; r:10966-11655
MKNRRRNSKKKGGRNKNKKPATTRTNDNVAVANNDTTTIANNNSEGDAATLTLQLSNVVKRGLCFHGMSEGYVNAVGRDALQPFLVDVYSHDCKESTVNHLANLQMLHLVHPVMDQPGMIQLLYGLAATFSLQEWTTPNLKKAMLTLRAALYLDKCMEKPSREDHHHQLVEKWLQVKWYCVKHCGSIHDAIVYLDKKVPCHCLADLKTKVLATRLLKSEFATTVTTRLV